MKKHGRNKMKPALLLIFIMFCFAGIYGQDNCTQNYLDAVKLFEQGFLDEVPPKLINCLEKGFTKNEKIDAYKLLIQTYLYDDNHQEAEKYMAKFLKSYPEYDLIATDPDVFVYLYNQYNTKPILQAGFIVGGMQSYYRIKNNYGTDNSANDKSKYSSSGVGLNLGLCVSKNIIDQFDVNLELLYNTIQIKDNDTNYFIENSSPYSESQFTYNISQISFPLSVSYDITSFDIKPVTLIPYGKIGCGFSILFNPYSLNNATSPSNIWTYKDGTNKPLKDMFNTYKWHLLAGAGIKIPIPSGSIVIDLKYNYGITPLIKKGYNYSDPELYEGFFSVPDIFTTDNFEFTVSYRKSFYNPKRKIIK